ncbi:MAG TPA: transglutaminase family protein [Azonexus sp.]|nr:transglutaminase family protein [Azonexus sp.]
MLTIRHITIYRYARPVLIGRHRLMFRPRDSHDLRLLSATLTISPPAASIRWLHDVFGNSVAIAEFTAKTAELCFQSDITVEHYALDHPDFPIEEYARTYPFSYSNDEIPDLGRLIERHYPDPEHKVDNWAKQFATPEDGSTMNLVHTQPMLERMMLAIKTGFVYAARYAEGTQSPVETLELGRGSCRDFSLLMIDAVRSLGFAARFVSGYQYDPATDYGTVHHPGTGAMHAWVQIYLPGAGWVEFDPTNAIVGGKDLIRVAVARDPHQAVPLSGEWIGTPADDLGMEVSVIVTSAIGQGDESGLGNALPTDDA